MRAHLGGSSRQSLLAARTALDAAVKGVDAQSASSLSTELFFIANVLGSNIAVRRALTDPSRDAQAKGAFIKDLLASKVGAAALGLLTEISALRWSGAKDLVQVIEQLAIEAEASAANISGELDRVEDEIFTAATAFAGSSELRKAVTSDATNAKAALVAEVLKNASSSTVNLVSQMVNAWRGRSIEAAFADYYYYLGTRVSASAKAKAYWARSSSQGGTFELVQFDSQKMPPHFAKADVGHYAAAAAYSYSNCHS